MVPKGPKSLRVGQGSLVIVRNDSRCGAVGRGGKGKVHCRPFRRRWISSRHGGGEVRRNRGMFSGIGLGKKKGFIIGNEVGVGMSVVNDGRAESVGSGETRHGVQRGDVGGRVKGHCFAEVSLMPLELDAVAEGGAPCSVGEWVIVVGGLAPVLR